MFFTLHVLSKSHDRRPRRSNFNLECNHAPSSHAVKLLWLWVDKLLKPVCCANTPCGKHCTAHTRTHTFVTRERLLILRQYISRHRFAEACTGLQHQYKGSWRYIRFFSFFVYHRCSYPIRTICKLYTIPNAPPRTLFLYIYTIQ